MEEIGEELLRTQELYGGPKSYRTLLADYKNLVQFVKNAREKTLKPELKRDWMNVSRRILFAAFLAVTAVVVGPQRAQRIAGRASKEGIKKSSDFLLKLCNNLDEFEMKDDDLRSAIGRLAAAVVQSNAARVSKNWDDVKWWDDIFPKLIANLEEQIGRRVDVSELLITDLEMPEKKRTTESEKLLPAGRKIIALLPKEGGKETPAERNARMLVIPPQMREIKTREKKKIRKPKSKPETSKTGPEEKPQNIVMTFGVFDGLHEGHKYFLSQAKKFGDKLVAVVASDGVVERLKNKTPRYNVKERVAALKESGLADDVREGDNTLGNWSIISRVRPQFIVVGYDQEELEFEAAAFIIESGLDMKIRKVAAFEPEKYKSSLINQDA